MLPRQSRLSRQDIEKLSKAGKSAHTPLFSVKTLPIEGKISKFAFVMSKKEEKTAVGRNKAKRRIRAAMRKLLPSLKPLYCIVFIKKSVLKAPFNDIVVELQKALHQYV